MRGGRKSKKEAKRSSLCLFVCFPGECIVLEEQLNLTTIYGRKFLTHITNKNTWDQNATRNKNSKLFRVKHKHSINLHNTFKI